MGDASRERRMEAEEEEMGMDEVWVMRVVEVRKRIVGICMIGEVDGVAGGSIWVDYGELERWKDGWWVLREWG